MHVIVVMATEAEAEAAALLSFENNANTKEQARFSSFRAVNFVPFHLSGLNLCICIRIYPPVSENVNAS